MPLRGRALHLRGRSNVYRFAPEKVNHYFCKHCGIYPFHDPVEAPEWGYRINLECVDEVNAHSLPIRVWDGADSWTWLE